MAWSADLFGVPVFCIKSITDIVDGDRPAQVGLGFAIEGLRGSGSGRELCSRQAWRRQCKAGLCAVPGVPASPRYAATVP